MAISKDLLLLNKEKFQTKLLQWFQKNKRDLPWRKNRDPYAIWVSEIMLQQTQVNTVIPYYNHFLKTFPTIRDLTKANLSKVLTVWEGLGYYSRARNLHQASRIIANHFKGKIPETPKDLLSLPGIGRYTAGAILSIAYNKVTPILDGNVKRVLSRLFVVSGHPKKTEEFLWPLSESLIPKGSPGAFNQALMDLGSMICTPKIPNCLSCPLKNLCQGYLSGKPESYPLRSVKKKVPHIEAIAAVIQKDGKVLLRQRPPRGLLGGLWEFPHWKIEEKRRLRLRLRNYIKKEMGVNVEVKEPIGTFHQTYSHFKLTLHVFKCDAIDGSRKGKWIPIKNLSLLPLSSIHRKIAKTIIPK
ncbi:MAG: A/G-specific adenine glycosylase [Thermodesulfobacteriota bacterium]|nr:A/G-specific adenine glycosylase [Thermodesulfobacteriota bacterium]